MGSHSSRAELDEHDPGRLSFASALRHLREMTIIFAKNGGRRGREFMDSARHMAAKRCQDDRGRLVIGEVMKSTARAHRPSSTQHPPLIRGSQDPSDGQP